MEKHFFYGDLTPREIAHALLAEFNQGNLRTQLLGEGDSLAVQIATSEMARSGGKTALTVYLQKTEEGVMVGMGQQEWVGVAASLGITAIAALLKPANLLYRLDDLIQDISNLQLSERVWQVIENLARARGTSRQLSERLQRLTCEYCGVTNPIGQPTCMACGAPLGKSQPRSCHHCGYVLMSGEKFCPNCGRDLP